MCGPRLQTSMSIWVVSRGWGGGSDPRLVGKPWWQHNADSQPKQRLVDILEEGQLGVSRYKIELIHMSADS